MAKTTEQLLQQAVQIRDEQANKKNTALRVGTLFSDIIEKQDEDVTDLDKSVKDNKEKLTELGNKANSVGYIVCQTNGSTAAKTITVDGITEITSNLRLLVQMNFANTAGGSVTLNINNLGAKTLYYNGATVSAINTWETGEIVELYYANGAFQCFNAKGGSGNGGNMILEWNTDVANTRKQVLPKDRKGGMQISYKPDDSDEWVNEQYIGTLFTDTEWAKDANWERMSNESDIEKNIKGGFFGLPIKEAIYYNTFFDISGNTVQKEKYELLEGIPLAFNRINSGVKFVSSLINGVIVGKINLSENDEVVCVGCIIKGEAEIKINTKGTDGYGIVGGKAKYSVSIPIQNGLLFTTEVYLIDNTKPYNKREILEIQYEGEGIDIFKQIVFTKNGVFDINDVYTVFRGCAFEKIPIKVNTELIEYLNMPDSSNGFNRRVTAPNDLAEKYYITYIGQTISTANTTVPLYGVNKITLTPTKKYIACSVLVRTKSNINKLPNVDLLKHEGSNIYTSSSSAIKTIDSHLYEITMVVSVPAELMNKEIEINLNNVNLVLESIDTEDEYSGVQTFYYRFINTDTDEIEFELNDSVIYTNYIKRTKQTTVGKYKKICVYGTSIEATDYFQIVADYYGLKKGVGYMLFGQGGGTTTFNPELDKTMDTVGRTHITKYFSCTRAEQEQVANEVGIPIEDLATSTYDLTLLPNIDADLFIFGTYGINDGVDAYEIGDEMDVKTTYGAYNFILDKLFEAKPNAKVIILGQHQLYVWTHAAGPANEVQRKVAAKWGIPFLDWGYKLGFNAKNARYYAGDGEHPNDNGRKAMAKFLIDWLDANYHWIVE